MVQVELAQLRYRLPRLRGRGNQLSQQGARASAPGVPARPSSRSIGGASCRASPSSNATSTAWPRTVPPNARRAAAAPRPPSRSSGTPTPASRRLLNRLTTADVLVEDRLFSTLDPTTRRLRLPGRRDGASCPTPSASCGACPHQLVESFQSTLEEVVDADLLLHVVDASSPRRSRPDRRGPRRASRDRRRSRARAARDQQGRHRRRRVRSRSSWPRIRRRSSCPPPPARVSTGCSTRSSPGCGTSRRSSSSSCPTSAATSSPRCTATARCSSRCTPKAARGSGRVCRRSTSPRFGEYVVTVDG